MRILISLIAMFPSLGCSLGVAPVGGPRDPTALNILFIGNSLTTTNDLPGVLEALIDSAGAGPAEVASVAFPNFGLEDHWATGDARTAIEAGGWRFVVIQQGPSATEGRPSLLAFSDSLAKPVRSIGAEPALYMVWPALARFGDFDGVRDSYRAAAENTGGLFLPAGEAWRLAWSGDSTLTLYGLDGFHPSPLGTYLAALVMFEQFTGRSPLGLARTVRTRSGVTIQVDEQTAAALQSAASQANRQFAMQLRRAVRGGL